ncbi:penicillin-binding protein [Caldibacillus lycopersici]|uniref:Penicillin-binding protein n=1 Tax=Perspicuibacillus lycopersici TaxID=1325689 RepID=A0AAE3LR53_9BACI|nr:transglycosylase domain-containing protein [Perspicuibacillus lycopersici]MCU9614229.1 penicillin-binding protein [Perspicuibacillus lycopersici]
MKNNWENFSEKVKPIFKKIKPIKDAILNQKTAKAFRITYSVIWNLILIFSILFVLGLSLGAGVGAGYFASLVKDEEPRTYDELKKDIYNYEAPSELYFANDVELGTLRSDIIREEVSIEDVSDYVIKAIIATEDENFREHNGVVPKAVFRALFQEFTNSAVQSGGSTLTQQLVKNQILTNEVSFQRKANEILIALRLEKFFDKDEILEAYLNVSSFGRNSSGQYIAGVQAAAKGIFGVEAKDLNLPQAAYIAGLPQSPNGYTPFTRDATVKEAEYLQPGLDRQKVVLSRMYEHGDITKQEYEDALAYDIVQDFIPPQKTILDKYPYLTMESERRAIEILMQIAYEKDGYSKEDIAGSALLKERYSSIAYKNLRQNGYKIYTTIDKDVYEKHLEIVEKFKNYGPDKPQEMTDEETGKVTVMQQQMEVGAMLIENNTGKIISFVGGRDFEKQNQNHATQGGRPNGSTMKPLLVYGPAIDMGLASPGKVIADVDLGLKGDSGDPWPNNFSNRYYGLVTAREAITNSYNVSAVNLLQQTIDRDPFEYLDKMGITSLQGQDYKYLSAALGAPNVTVEENTNAYATFANGGKFVDSYMIEKIVDGDGNVVYQHESEPVEVFSEQAAYLTIDMMRDVISSGTAKTIPGLLKFSSDFAGKTGTSQNTQDISFVGFNPNVTMGIWMGYDTPKEITSDTRAHLQLWAQLMNAAYDVNPDLINASERFNMPGGIVQRTYCSVSGMLASDTCEKAGLTATDYFISEFAPKEKDNSLVEGKYVTINKKRYLALDSTPDEFAKTGFILNPDFIKQIAPNLKDYSQLIHDGSKWSKIIVPDAKIEDNGKSPAAITISLANGSIKWNKHSETDVIGYYVYRINNGQKSERIGSIPIDSSLSYQLPGNGQYAVTAVDIAGKESALSNIVNDGITIDPPPKDGGDRGIIIPVLPPGDEKNE